MDLTRKLICILSHYFHSCVLCGNTRKQKCKLDPFGWSESLFLITLSLISFRLHYDEMAHDNLKYSDIATPDNVQIYTVTTVPKSIYAILLSSRKGHI